MQVSSPFISMVSPRLCPSRRLCPRTGAPGTRGRSSRNVSLSCPGGLLGRYQFCLCPCDLRSASGSRQVVLQSSMETPLASLLCRPGRGAALGPRHGYQGSTNTAPVTFSLASPVAKAHGQSSVLALPWLLGHSPLLPSFYLMVPTSQMQLLLFRGPQGSRHHFLCLHPLPW